MNSPVLQRLLLVRGLRAFADGYVSLLHLPSSIFLVLIPFMPNSEWAIALLLARAALSQMDVPTRSACVMAIVPPAERAAAASVTAVPRSLAAAIGSLMAGYLLSVSSFGWPLVIAGVLKIIYDLLLLLNFKALPPPEDINQVSKIAAIKKKVTDMGSPFIG